MRVWRSLALALGLLLPAACGDSSSADLPPFEVGLQDIFGNAAGPSNPIDLQAPPGDPRLFIAELTGRISVVQAGVLLPTSFLDISSRVLPLVGESGLLSFAFHPQFASGQPFVFVHFIEKNANPNGDIVVDRYRVSSTDSNVLQVPGIEVIRIPHADDTNHYGGRVAFGPDGMLYLSTGDGGGGGDQYHNSQNVTTHLAKLLRLDVSTLPYTIPPDNPVFPGATRNENWAMGLRNPFRYAFDFPTGQLVIADVGQGAREEIDVVPADSPGLNYGWNIMEGMRCYPNGGTCNMTGLTLPVYDYDHSQGCAIIGGYVYRGAAVPELQGSYVFSDLCSGWLRSLLFANGVVNVRQASVNVGTPHSFGQDGFGEIYVLTSRVLRVVRQ